MSDLAKIFKLFLFGVLNPSEFSNQFLGQIHLGYSIKTLIPENLIITEEKKPKNYTYCKQTLRED